MGIRKTFAFAAVFALGVLTDRALVGHPSPPRVRAPEGVAACGVSDSVKTSTAANLALPMQPPTQIRPQTSAFQATSAAEPRKPHGSFAIERPKNETPVLGAEMEEHLFELVKNPFPSLPSPVRKTNDDGSVDVSAKDDDGNSLYQHYNSRGELTHENWKDASGDNVYRSFYSSGALKIASWNRSDHSLTSINFTESGNYETRFDKFPDGSSVATNYDDDGQVKSVWRNTADGKSTRIQ